MKERTASASTSRRVGEACGPAWVSWESGAASAWSRCVVRRSARATVGPPSCLSCLMRRVMAVARYWRYCISRSSAPSAAFAFALSSDGQFQVFNMVRSRFLFLRKRAFPHFSAILTVSTWYLRCVYLQGSLDSAQAFFVRGQHVGWQLWYASPGCLKEPVQSIDQRSIGPFAAIRRNQGDEQGPGKVDQVAQDRLRVYRKETAFFRGIVILCASLNEEKAVVPGEHRHVDRLRLARLFVNEVE